MKPPLKGLRVVDLSHAISGPTCTQMLVQMGADVIKVEPPKVGDDFRHYTEHAGLPLMSIPFAATNAGKRSVTLNLKSEGGRAVLEKLIIGADILVENFRPGVLARLGFPRERLHELNPRLISASISGFGQSGPLANWGAYDHIAQSMSGLAQLNGSEQEGPRKIGLPVIDSFSGYLAVIAILAALRARDSSGKGEHLDIAMVDAALKLMPQSVSVCSYTGEPPKGLGNRGYRLVATAEFYPTKDGWIALGANHQPQVERLFEVLGADALADPRFATHQARVAHYDELRSWLTEKLSTEHTEDLEARLTAANIPAAKIRNVGETIRHPHIVERGVIEKAILPGADKPLEMVGVGFQVDPPEAPLEIPTLGKHTDSVLAELGYSPDDIAALRTDGAL